MNDKFYKTLLDSLFDGVYFVDNNKIITYWNKSAERITGYSAEEVVGTKCGDNLLNHMTDCGKHLCKGDCPLSFSISDGYEREAELFLRTKSGARIPVKIKVTPITDDQGKITGAVEIFSDNTSAVAAYEMVDKLRELAFIDESTGLPNKKYMAIKVENLLSELEKHDVRFGMVIVTFSNYSQSVEKNGIEKTESVIRVIAETLKAIIAPYHVLGRFGDDSFIIVVPNARKDEFETFRDRLRIIIDNCNLGYIRLSDDEDIDTSICFSGGIVNSAEEIDGFFAE